MCEFSNQGPGGAAQARPETENRLQRIVESAMDGIITVYQRGRIIMFNQAAERMFGVPASEAIGGTLERFLPPHVRPAHDRHIAHFGETGVSNRTMGNLGTISGLRADGSEFPIEASISQVRVGSEQFFSAILRDITDRKRLEAQLLQSQKMEGVGRLAGGIAHDFNNLVMAIFNYLALATRKLGPDHPVTPSLAQAHLAAQRAADLTRQLLMFARKQAVAPRVFSPRDIVGGLVPMLRRLTGHDVALRTTLAEDTGNVRADSSQFEQVLVNLAINARDAMPDGGTLSIHTSNRTLDEAHCREHADAAPGDYVEIAVVDTGVGMTPDVLSQIFEPFFTTKPPGKGTGLGLATCHGIVKQSGGHISVRSTPGKGTRVRVLLPRVHSQVSDHAAGATTPVPRGTETILFVEESALVRELVGEELLNAGYQVLSAGSGAEALRLAQSASAPIHLLLTEVVLPEMSGVQLADRLGAILSVPVIYISGHPEDLIAAHGVEMEKAPFLAKPYAPEALLHLIHQVLHRNGRA